MKILVTGSEGSLMQFVIPYLLEKGHEVVGGFLGGVDSQYYSKKKKFEDDLELN